MSALNTQSAPSLRERLLKGDYLYSATLTIPSPEMAARIAASGFDFLWIELEHSPISLESLRAMVLVTRGFGAVPIARVPAVELWAAKRVLDSGVLGVIFPFVNDADAAKCAAQACRYPTTGLRGSGAGFASFRWPVENYYDFADKNVICVALVESAEGLSNVEEIAATPGVDVVFVGVSDLAFSLGLRGNWNHPQVEEAITRIAAAARKHGKFLGRPALTIEEVRRFHAAGFQFFQGPTDVDLLGMGTRRLLEPLGRFQASPRNSATLY
jgi:2-keto-3-deoxy-L-rhamnonate aldolase RhmA